MSKLQKDIDLTSSSDDNTHTHVKRIIAHNTKHMLSQTRTFAFQHKQSAVQQLLQVSSEFIGIVVHFVMQFRRINCVIVPSVRATQPLSAGNSLYDAIAQSIGANDAFDVRYLLLWHLSNNAKLIVANIHNDYSLLCDVFRAILLDNNDVFTVDVVRVLLLLLANVTCRDIVWMRREGDDCAQQRSTTNSKSNTR